MVSQVYKQTVVPAILQQSPLCGASSPTPCGWVVTVQPKCPIHLFTKAFYMIQIVHALHDLTHVGPPALPCPLIVLMCFLNNIFHTHHLHQPWLLD